MKNARRDKLNSFNNNSVDKEILKMKQFLINTSTNDLKSSTEEILGLIDGRKEETV